MIFRQDRKSSSLLTLLTATFVILFLFDPIVGDRTAQPQATAGFDPHDLSGDWMSYRPSLR
jgi:hypothetical protein